ncbi:HAMP domain-containing sensor histidine kinase [Clostridium boliviensis]|uniref:histidine kinase n=1 Tax=Clostridium boliviensis TaxID=318465 RepID=A0ABU4GKL1_9CLOT|nr:HAMP domain-containing sensor histidine kinase [Clostridium boliviensis]MDW2798158.1 HAMP domain-containing sensor histidine kinase [Clostridium boliviensis]
MKHSIKARFAIVFVCLMAFVLLCTWCVNNLFLESFYTRAKVHILEMAYTEIDKVVDQANESGKGIIQYYYDSYDPDYKNEGPVQKMFRTMGEKYNLMMVLIDSTTDKFLMSTSGDPQFLKNRVEDYIFGKDMPQASVLKKHENYIIQKAYDKRSDSYYLESWGYFSDNKTIFLISIPLSSIRDSVALSNQFLAYVGSIALIIGSLFIYFTTKRITTPILQLANLSEKMSGLDFEAKYTGDEKDEIGILGNSMNQLSDRLKDTIGQLRSANEELQKDIEEKVKIDEMRKDFIANVSHELKTPIALIQGYAEGLTEGMAEDPESRDYYCEVIMDEANKMNKMVRQLLNLTALEFGNDDLQLECFDLTELIRGVIGSSGILIQQKEAKVKLETFDKIRVCADEFKIEEVITNYINNALNHLGGEREIIITAEENGKEALVTVFNTGQNIPEEDIPKLWTKFFKVDKAHTREYGGSGIGLSIVKAIIDSHNKTCGVRNVKGGVEFWFTLDCYQEKG